MKVLCYGDSNTYGYDPRGFFGDCYPKESRWVDILAQKLKWEIQNEGQNGGRFRSDRFSISVPGSCWRGIRRIFSQLCWVPTICSGAVLLRQAVPAWRLFCGTSSPSAE